MDQKEKLTPCTQFDVALDRLVSAADSTIQFEHFNLERLTGCHPITVLLDGPNNNGPYLLVSAFHETQDAGDASRSVRNDSFVGSPLKLRDYQRDFVSCNGHEHSANTGQRYPISLNDARYLVSLYNISCQRPALASHSVVPLVVMCDAKDRQHVVYMSSHYVKSHPDTFIIFSESVILKGPFVDRSKLPSVESLQEDYPSPRNASHTVSYTAEYELYGQTHHGAVSTSSDCNNGMALDVGAGAAGKRGSSVSVKLNWRDRSPPMETPPLSATCVVSVAVTPGEQCSIVAHMYDELLTLQGLVRGLVDGDIAFTMADTGPSVMDRVRKLIDAHKLGDAAYKTSITDTTDSTSDELSAVRQLWASKRQDLDFTELLWNILKDCACYAELTSCLQVVVDTLYTSELQPMVHRSNKTSMAELVRASYSGNMQKPSLQGVLPVRLVSEIGVEKLTRDYIQAFLGKDLVTAGHLAYFAEVLDGTDLAGRVTRLFKLHQVLDVASRLDCLKLPHTTLGTLTRQALKYYEQHDIGDQDKFSSQIQTQTVANLLNKNEPYLWRMQSTTHIGNRDLHEAYVYTTSLPFQHVSQPVQDTDDIAEVQFYITVVNQWMSEL